MFDLIRRNSNNSVNDYNPFHQMEDMERRFFGPEFDNFFRGNNLAACKSDVTDEGDHYLLEADLPGFNKEDVHLDLDGDTLTIQAERHSNVEQKEHHQVVRVERSYGTYSRSFDVSGIDTDKITAKYENGVLSLTLPKQAAEAPTSHRIKIE